MPFLALLQRSSFSQFRTWVSNRLLYRMPRRQYLAAIFLVFAWFWGVSHAAAQGVGGISLGNIAVPTVTPTPTPTPTPISSIYVTNPTLNSVSVFPTGSNGNATSLFTETYLSTPQGIAYSNGYLYVANQATDSITVYPASASGPSNPRSTISGRDRSRFIGKHLRG
jgi:hypothetical protein